MSLKKPGNTRVAILTLILVVLAGIAFLKFVVYGDMTLERPASPPPLTMALTQGSPVVSRGDVVWLAPNHAQYEYCYKGLIARELYRQAVLLAARDELGLQTRDSSLREWRTTPDAANGLEMNFLADGIHLQDVAGAKYLRWVQAFSNQTWPTDLDGIAVNTERMSRADFVNMLKKAGWSGSENATKADAPAPADAESRLGEMEELSQFGVLRETHAAIRSDGESLQRLGVLVRAYANLGQLTRYHWSEEFAVYTARSLLYAQRMVVEHHGSAMALWHRAYARAMAGLQGDALEDLKAAGQLPGEKPPDWVKLLEPFCNYQVGTLVNMATGNPKLSTLGMFMAFLSVENSGSQGAVMNISSAALTLNPRCLRIIDAMCENTGPGMLNELSETGPTTFSRTLGSELQKVPMFPKRLSDQIDGFRRPEGNPLGRQIICRELIDEGVPDKDKTEPSWAVLGRLIEETTFAHIARKANLIAEQWGVDASDYVQECQPYIEGHPFKFVIDVYGLQHQQNLDLSLLKHTLSEPLAAQQISTLRQMPVYMLDSFYLPDGPQSAANYFGWIQMNTDYTSVDIENMIKVWGGNESNGDRSDWLSHLQQVSPQSAVLMAVEIRTQWNDAGAAEWESHADNPAVALALGRKFTELKKWPDAEKYLRQYIAVAPDETGYEALATVYRDQKKTDQWLATLKEYLQRGQDYGLQFAQVQVKIANYYMKKRDYRSALPYADAAGQTASAWGMECAAEAHTGVGDWATAEQLITDEMDHYSLSPFTWYQWCTRTGHGNLAAATKAMDDYFAARQGNLSKEDMIQLGCLQIIEQKNSDARQTFERRLKAYPGPVSAIHIAMIDDEMGDAAGRDAMLDRIAAMPEHDTVVGRFAALIRAATKPGGGSIDTSAVNAILDKCDDSMRGVICAVMAQYLDDHDTSGLSVAYWKRCAQTRQYGADRLIAETKLRQKGIDPMTLEQSPTGGNRSN